jgi:fumarylpyruvate hydrolase
MTRRDRQRESGKNGLPWEIGKSFDGSAPCGNLRTVAEVGHIQSGRIAVSVNGQSKQDSVIEKMIWNVPEIVSNLSHLYDLAEGDLIYTGTPAGVAPVLPGDILRGSVQGLSDLEITIVARS